MHQVRVWAALTAQILLLTISHETFASASEEASKKNPYAHIACGTRIANAVPDHAEPRVPAEVTTYLKSGALPTDPVAAIKVLEIVIAQETGVDAGLPKWLLRRYVESKWDPSAKEDPSELRFFVGLDNRAEDSMNLESLQSAAEVLQSSTAKSIQQKTSIPGWLFMRYWRISVKQVGWKSKHERRLTDELNKYK